MPKAWRHLVRGDMRGDMCGDMRGDMRGEVALSSSPSDASHALHDHSMPRHALELLRADGHQPQLRVPRKSRQEGLATP
eukprot:CAMPEP_0197604576 /NCGR_PEP_ID=MMETSP1326-20131121/41447_1 /TAXON_ID=1155430 /ORGANISM="Genus nov. species nov., Strain RCC2288" /LENGTH=78 /DNA_ID=CAMNT_0043172265 /DNA_START=347 /DNA_END=580 /DNA_ORIENTATION=-